MVDTFPFRMVDNLVLAECRDDGAIKLPVACVEMVCDRQTADAIPGSFNRHGGSIANHSSYVKRTIPHTFLLDIAA